MFFLLAVAGRLVGGPSSARADDPDFLTLGVGIFDFNDDMTTGMGAIDLKA